LKNLVKYIKSEFPNKVLGFNEEGVYDDGIDSFTKEKYENDADELIGLISQNNTRSRESLEADIDNFLLEHATVQKLEDVLHNAYC
jgi:hypothetical protein